MASCSTALWSSPTSTGTTCKQQREVLPSFSHPASSLQATTACNTQSLPRSCWMARRLSREAGGGDRRQQPSRCTTRAVRPASRRGCHNTRRRAQQSRHYRLHLHRQWTTSSRQTRTPCDCSSPTFVGVQPSHQLWCVRTSKLLQQILVEEIQKSQARSMTHRYTNAPVLARAAHCGDSECRVPPDRSAPRRSAPKLLSTGTLPDEARRRRTSCLPRSWSRECAARSRARG